MYVQCGSPDKADPVKDLHTTQNATSKTHELFTSGIFHLTFSNHKIQNQIRKGFLNVYPKNILVIRGLKD